MTLDELIHQLYDLKASGVPSDAKVRAYDGDSGRYEEVSGFVTGVPTAAEDFHVVELQTDDN